MGIGKRPGDAARGAYARAGAESPAPSEASGSSGGASGSVFTDGVRISSWHTADSEVSLALARYAGGAG